MEELTFGNILTIITVVIGLIIQYVAFIMRFSERIARIEIKHEHVEKDINNLFKLFREVMTSLKHMAANSERRDIK